MQINPFDYTPGYRKPLRVLPSRLGNLGVFCDVPITKDAVIEVDNLAILKEKSIARYVQKNPKTKIRNYLFGFNNSESGFPTGFGPFYNHAFTEPDFLSRNNVRRNARFEIDTHQRTIAFVATQDIAAGHEILIDYMRGFRLEYNLGVTLFKRNYGGLRTEDGLMTPMPRYAQSEEQIARSVPFEQAHEFRDINLEREVAQIEEMGRSPLLKLLDKMMAKRKSSQPQSFILIPQWEF